MTPPPTPTDSARFDRVWAPTASMLVGAVMAITSGIRGPAGWLAVISVIALGALAMMEARSPARVRGWMRIVPFALLLVAAVAVMAVRM